MKLFNEYGHPIVANIIQQRMFDALVNRGVPWRPPTNQVRRTGISNYCVREIIKNRVHVYLLNNYRMGNDQKFSIYNLGKILHHIDLSKHLTVVPDIRGISGSGERGSVCIAFAGTFKLSHIVHYKPLQKIYEYNI